MKHTRQIVLGAAAGYEPEQMHNFASSLRATGYDGDIVFFVQKASGRAQAFFKRLDITPQPIAGSLFNSRFRKYFVLFFKLFRQANRSDLEFYRLYEYWLRISSTRYIAYQRYLENVDTWYDEFIFADTRDIVFQRNPFDADYGCDIAFFEEHEDQKIASNTFNNKWVLEAYGKSGLKSLANEIVICSGLTYARGHVAKLYLDAMVTEIGKTNSRSLGIDQGHHNHIARHGSLPGSKIIPQKNSLVWNICMNPASSIRFNPDGYLINTSGQIATIVQQYDRHEWLTRNLIQKLCAENRPAKSP